MSNSSQREAYAEKRNLYYERVYALYMQGMTTREIAKEVPIGKSTIHRWIEKHIKNKGEELPPGVIIPRTPAAVAKMIKAMAARISALESENKVLRKRVSVLEAISELIKPEDN